jgi:phosphonate transport system ATP-binding protein
VDDGLTAVVCLHQVDLARMFGERVIGMRAGRIVFDGPPEALDDAALAAIYGTEVTGDETAHRAGRRAAVS